MQPESAMRGGTDDKEARAEADAVVNACAGGMLGRNRLTGAGRDLTGERGRSMQSESRQKGLTKSEE